MRLRVEAVISHPANTEACVEAILEALPVGPIDGRPPRVLDLGSGFGKWGVIVREALASRHAERTGDLVPDPMRLVHLVGSEVAAYFDHVPWLPAVYDDLMGDGRHADLAWFDLVLLIDVAEHWPLAEGATFIDRCVAADTKVLVSTPREVVFYEPEFYGPDCPKHETQWEAENFDRWANLDYSTAVSHVRLVTGPR